MRGKQGVRERGGKKVLETVEVLIRVHEPDRVNLPQGLDRRQSRCLTPTSWQYTPADYSLSSLSPTLFCDRHPQTPPNIKRRTPIRNLAQATSCNPPTKILPSPWMSPTLRNSSRNSTDRTLRNLSTSLSKVLLLSPQSFSPLMIDKARYST